MVGLYIPNQMLCYPLGCATLSQILHHQPLNPQTSLILFCLGEKVGFGFRALGFNQKPYALNPRPTTLNPKPKTPQTLNPTPKALNRGFGLAGLYDAGMLKMRWAAWVSPAPRCPQGISAEPGEPKKFF